jgi:hypothetical protein
VMIFWFEAGFANDLAIMNELLSRKDVYLLHAV